MSSPVMVHVRGEVAVVEFDDESMFQTEVCEHFLSEAHTNPKAIQTEIDRRRRAALEAEGKLVDQEFYDRGIVDPSEEGT